MSLEIFYNCEKGNLKNKEDALICCIHFRLISKGFKCIGSGEEVPIDDVKKSDMLPSEWSKGESYSLLYQHEASGDTFVLKIVKFDAMLLVHLLRFKDDKASSLEVKVADHVDDLISFESAFKNTDGLWKLIDKELLGPFADETKKSPQRNVPQPQQNEPCRGDPLRVPPHRNEWEEHRDPFMIGRNDLDPLAGPHGGGMIFDPMRSGMPTFCGPYGGIGRPNRLPRGAVPPGARFDPFGPPDIDPSGRRNPDYRNPRPGPDPDHLPPPGYDDMFM